ncbi:uncharacterized protein LOC127752398 [Oryza glaberrima]|nr:uncharacterized protein LOC127752398 [Oryza glaberrima]
MNSEPPPSMASSLMEATGDSESDAAAVDRGSCPADDGDAESCCGGDQDGGGGAAAAGSVEALSWERWMREYCAGYQLVVAADDGKCAAPATEDDVAAAGDSDAESDRLFWEACIAHGF